MGPLTYLVHLLQSGLGNLAAYLAAHVLLCLLPAFFIAGALAALVPKESVTRFLGRNAPKYVSYPAAALAGSVLAVCSCTIVPLFAGIYKKGAGIGPAITFLFFAPAANILALAYTGVLIGPDIALARILLSLVFGIGGPPMELRKQTTNAGRNTLLSGCCLGFSSVALCAPGDREKDHASTRNGGATVLHTRWNVPSRPGCRRDRQRSSTGPSGCQRLGHHSGADEAGPGRSGVPRRHRHHAR